MASNILGIGSSALAAAQTGLATTGHNIANASTPGYSRQVVTQAAAKSQNFGFGFVGQGTEVASVSRVYSEILTRQVVSSQAASSSSQTYNTQLSNINNMLSDASAGLNPAMSDFFKSVNDVAANPSDTPTRQSMLSYAQSLVNRLQSTGSRLNEVRDNINTQLTGSVGLVNSYATQIASLNDVIEKAVSANGVEPNDLMDQRDQLVSELSKQIKTTVAAQGQGSYNIFIGNGLPLVIGKITYSLTTANSPTEPGQLDVAYMTKGKESTVLGSSSLPGGAIGGLLQFRAESLDSAQNQIGQIAVVLAETFNTQLKRGIDLNGSIGGNLFNVPAPIVSPNSENLGDAVIVSQLVDARALTSSDYRLQYDGSNYIVTRLSDNTVTNPVSLPQTIDGLSFDLSSGSMTAGDSFLIRPTRNAATSISLAITDVKKLALRAAFDASGNPIVDALGNPIVDALGNPIDTLGNPILDANGNPVIYPGDNTNALLLAGLQSQATLNSSTGGGTNYSSAFAKLVNDVGNKSRELKVNAASEAMILEQATAAVQSESGVNLDEEATNLLRYQQAYQAAAKMMQIASKLFDELLQLG